MADDWKNAPIVDDWRSAPIVEDSTPGSGPGGLPSSLRGMAAIPDLLATLGSGLVGQAGGVATALPSFLYGAMKPTVPGLPSFSPKRGIESVIGGPEGPGSFDTVSNALTVGPFTDTGKQAMQSVAEAVEPIDTAITDFFGNAFPGSPATQALGKTAVMGPIELLGLKGLGRGASAVKQAATTVAPPGTFIPSIKDLFATGRVAFNEARINSGGIRPEALARAARSARNINNEYGIKIDFDADLHPDAFRVRQRLIDTLESGEVDFDKLLTLRELAGEVAGDMKPGISMRGVRLKNVIDDFVDSLGPDDVISGDPRRSAQALTSARQFWRDASAARTIEREIELAGNRAGQFSGSGFENALRTQFRQLSARIIKGRERGFTPAEIKAIRKVADGGKFDNLLRFFGKLAPTGVVSGAIGSGAGYAIGGPAGAVTLPAAGGLSRWLATQGTIGNANRALEAPLKHSLLDPTTAPPVR